MNGVHWLVLAHIGWLFSGVHDSVTNLMGEEQSDAHVQQHQIHIITQMHLELCARHCFNEKVGVRQVPCEDAKAMFNTIASDYALLSPTCI